MRSHSRDVRSGWIGLGVVVILFLFHSTLVGVWGEDQVPSGAVPAPQEGAVPAPAPSPWKLIPKVHPEDTRVGSEQCITCHADIYELDKQFRCSRAIWRLEALNQFGGCEACHGAGSRHVETLDDPKDLLDLGPGQHDNRVYACFICHPTFSQVKWLEGCHSQAGMDCYTCHIPVNHGVPELWTETELPTAPKLPLEPAVRSPVEPLFLLRIQRDERPEDLCYQCHAQIRAAFSQYSHMPLPEGRLTCTECHDPHATTPGHQLGEPVVSTCTRCHKEMEGPFAFEHDPISGGLAEGCVSCHDPHGSPNDDLLKLPDRGVCLQCHVEQAVGHFGGPTATCWTSGCHAQIHGSNDSPFFFR